MEAFKAIVDEHKVTVFRLAYDMTGNKHDAEDITQEVFIKAFRSLGKFRGDAKVSTVVQDNRQCLLRSPVKEVMESHEAAR